MLVPVVLLAQPWEPRPGVVDAPMNRPRWDAPRAAYLLTAALADNAALADTAFGTEWVGYDESAQQDILTALGAQTRLALRMLRDKLGMEIEMDSGGMPDSADAGIAEDTVRSACGEAAVAARELIKPSPRHGAAPECAHCREIVARTMCGLQIQAYFRLGFTSAMIAGTCRRSAGKAETPPRQ